MKSSKEIGNSKKVKDSVKTRNKETKRFSFTHDEIREKANEIYLQRIDRGEHGTPENDWTEAEIFLRESEY